ncbi:MAG: hypothetical protein KatS3mg129_2452 [Leptospiraceae bacterium]|nr:MAG: hypothetical protein KatS3mg129_2452 [Leptospiraceae bacterium]
MQVSLDFKEIYKKFQIELKPYIRIDNEIFDFIVISPIQSIEYVINRDISILFKPYTLLSIDIIKEKLKQLNFTFDYFYSHLEESLNYEDIIIPMIRYYLFIGSGRKIFQIFIELYKKKKVNDFIFLVSYLISKECLDYQYYYNFFDKVYSKEILSLFNSDTLFLLYFKKNFDILKERLYFSEQLKNNYVEWSKRFDDYKKILLNNWFLTNFLASGNIYTSIQFYLWTKKNESFQFHQEYCNSWNLKLSLILLKHHKWNVVKYLNHKDLQIYSLEEAYKKMDFFINLKRPDKEVILNYIHHLYFEFNLYDYYQLLCYYFEDILLLGIEWNQDKNDYMINSDIIWLKLENFIHNENLKNKFIKGFFEHNPMDISHEEIILCVLFILYKYRKKILYYAGFEPLFRSLIGLFYEKYKPFISLKLYKGNPHPLVIFRMNHLYKDYPNSDIIKKNYIDIKIKKYNGLIEE